jgi:hypothetical protein
VQILSDELREDLAFVGQGKQPIADARYVEGRGDTAQQRGLSLEIVGSLHEDLL